MATAWLRVDAFDALPGICVKTGVSTEIRLPIAAEYVPAGFRWLQLYGVWSFLFAHSANKRRRIVRIPVSRSAFRRHRAWQLGTVTLVVAGAAVGLYGSLTAHGLLEGAGYALAAVAFGIGARAHTQTWIGVNIDRKAQRVTISRCHPSFARAAGRVASR
jgi:hypothetical protein